MQFVITFVSALLFTAPLFSQSIFGNWKTIDDNTGEKKSIVKVYEENGKAFGKVMELFRGADEEQDPVCEECKDHRKGKKVKGMIVINDMEQDGDEWTDGKIMDPENGKVYKCKLWLEDAKTLKVRGYWGFLFRTQTWHRAD